MRGLAIALGSASPARASAGAAAAGAGHPAKPVIVLEHGAWADASSWNRVISQLQRDGFTVYAPPKGVPARNSVDGTLCLIYRVEGSVH